MYSTDVCAVGLFLGVEVQCNRIVMFLSVAVAFVVNVFVEFAVVVNVAVGFVVNVFVDFAVVVNCINVDSHTNVAFLIRSIAWRLLLRGCLFSECYSAPLFVSVLLLRGILPLNLGRSFRSLANSTST